MADLKEWGHVNAAQHVPFRNSLTEWTDAELREHGREQRRRYVEQYGEEEARRMDRWLESTRGHRRTLVEE